jgi:hypothetical protein
VCKFASNARLLFFDHRAAARILNCLDAWLGYSQITSQSITFKNEEICSNPLSCVTSTAFTAIDRAIGCDADGDARRASAEDSKNQAERDRKLDAAKEQRKNRRQGAA